MCLNFITNSNGIKKLINTMYLNFSIQILFRSQMANNKRLYPQMLIIGLTFNIVFKIYKHLNNYFFTLCTH